MDAQLLMMFLFVTKFFYIFVLLLFILFMSLMSSQEKNVCLPAFVVHFVEIVETVGIVDDWNSGSERTA